MNIALVLSGGTGTRLGADIPKQYIEVEGLPVIGYSLKTMQENPGVDAICIVAAREWEEYLLSVIQKEGISKFSGFAPAGISRQHSILNGLLYMENSGAGAGDNVLIHDSARPNLTSALIDECFKAMDGCEGVLPVIPVKDTVYRSVDGSAITSLLNRDELFAGQSPEVFDLKRYLDIIRDLSDDELSAVRGTSEIAYRKGFKIRLIPGDESNYKITTAPDLEKFIKQKAGELR